MSGQGDFGSKNFEFGFGKNTNANISPQICTDALIFGPERHPVLSKDLANPVISKIPKYVTSYFFTPLMSSCNLPNDTGLHRFTN